MGYVYLLLETDKDGCERHKIGMTKNDVEKRIKQLQTGNSNIITLLKTFQSPHYKHVEQWLHRKFNAQKTETKNEWFTLTDEQVLNFSKICEEVNQTVIFMLENNPFYK